MTITREADADIGRDAYRRIHRLVTRLAERHEIDVERAADYLLTGALFVAADLYDMDLDDTMAVMQALARSVRDDELPPATRH